MPASSTCEQCKDTNCEDCRGNANVCRTDGCKPLYYNVWGRCNQVRRLRCALQHCVAVRAAAAAPPRSRPLQLHPTAPPCPATSDCTPSRTPSSPSSHLQCLVMMCDDCGPANICSKCMNGAWLCGWCAGAASCMAGVRGGLGARQASRAVHLRSLQCAHADGGAWHFSWPPFTARPPCPALHLQATTPTGQAFAGSASVTRPTTTQSTPSATSAPAPRARVSYGAACLLLILCVNLAAGLGWAVQNRA